MLEYRLSFLTAQFKFELIIFIQKSLTMKVCHVCEKVVKVLRSVSCLNCKRSYCFPCISKYFAQKAKQLLPQTGADALYKSKTYQCFYCLKECVCHKCIVKSSILVQVRKDAKDQDESRKLSSFVNDQDIITQNGFFKGKKYSEMPAFMQRAYLEKKVLYSKHELSMPSMINIAQAEQMNVERLQEVSKKEEIKGGQSEQIEESLNPNQQGEFQVSPKNQIDIENQNQNQEQQHAQNEEDAQQLEQQNENIGSSQYNANQIAQSNQENNQQQENSEQNAGQYEAEQQEASSNKKESNQHSKRNRQMKVNEALQNVQDQSSIELIQEE